MGRRHHFLNHAFARLYSKDPEAIIFDLSSSQDAHEIFRQISNFCEVTQKVFGQVEMSGV